MSEHRATIAWTRSSKDFTYDSYNRDHEIRFAGITVAASAAPDYRGDATRMNPEEAFVAAISSCHMLSFLAIAARKHLPLESYRDNAVGTMDKNADGRLAVTRVSLRPQIVWSPGIAPTLAEIEAMHHLAHRECFIANSVTTEITVEPEHGQTSL